MSDDDLRDELQVHLEMRAELNRQQGIPENEALALAKRHFGNATLIQEEVRRVHINSFLESVAQDLRYAVRGLLHNPIFSLTAIFAAALGIGSTTAVFSVVDRILFRSLPYPHDDRLVSVGMIAPLDTNEFLLPEAYFGLRKNQTPFESITSFTAGTVDCDLTQVNPMRLGCARVEGNLLPVLGRSPLLGRNFTNEEDRPNGPRVALMSYALWRGRFGGDPAIVGKLIPLDGQPVTIIGVLPPDFEMPTLSAADLLVPEQLNETTERSGRALRVFARLKPDITVEQALAAMQPAFQQSLQTVPAPYRKEVRLRIRSLRDRQVQDARLTSWVLLAAVASVLLIACANIANLLLARSLARQRELAVRAALGAGRARLMRQTLTEAVLLGIAGGSAGSGLAWALLGIFTRIAPSGILRLEQATLDTRVFLFALTGSLLSALVFGLAPALQTPRAELLAGSRSTASPRVLLREWLVAAQIAMSLVLLTGASMLLRSLWNLQSVPLGLQAEHVVTAEFTLGKQGYSQDTRQLGFFNELESRMQQIPGVTTIAISDSLPPAGGMRGRPFAAIQVEGRPPIGEGTGGMVSWRYVSPGYFAALRIPIVRGRAFRDEDRTAAVQAVILSESLARRLFPNGDALGARLLVDGGATVVGIAADVRNAGPLRPADPEYYMVRRRTLDAVFRNQTSPGWRHGFVAVRTSMDARLMADWIKKELATLDPELPVSLATMNQRVGKLAERPRFNAVLLALFAGVGVLLAMIGLYGVMAFLVGQRSQEIGVRMALGATPGAITKLVLSRAMRWTIIGVGLGLGGSLFATQLLRTMLFNVPQRDPWTYGAVLPLLLLVALTAAWIPSRRAARVHPMTALRHE
jgi:predicted permease